MRSEFSYSGATTPQAQRHATMSAKLFRSQLGTAARTYDALVKYQQRATSGLVYAPMRDKRSLGTGILSAAGVTPAQGKKHLAKLRRLGVVQDVGWRFMPVAIGDGATAVKRVYCRRVVAMPAERWGPWGPEVIGPGKALDRVRGACVNGGKRLGAGRKKRVKDDDEVRFKWDPPRPKSTCSSVGEPVIKWDPHSILNSLSPNEVNRPEGGADEPRASGGSTFCPEDREALVAEAAPRMPEVPAVVIRRPPLLHPDTPSGPVRVSEMLRWLRGALEAGYGPKAGRIWVRPPNPKSSKKARDNYRRLIRFADMLAGAGVRPAEWFAFAVRTWRSKFGPGGPKPPLNYLCSETGLERKLSWFQSQGSAEFAPKYSYPPGLQQLQDRCRAAARSVRALPPGATIDAAHAAARKHITRAQLGDAVDALAARSAEDQQLIDEAVAAGRWVWGKL